MVLYCILDWYDNTPGISVSLPMVYDMKYCENCGRMHDGPLWETFIDGDNKPLEILVCSSPLFKEKEPDEKEKAEDKTSDNKETSSTPKPDKHKEEYDWEEEVKYEGFEFKF